MKKNLLLLFVMALTAQVFGQTTMENFSLGTITGTAADTLTNPAFGGNPALGNARWRRHSGSGGPIAYNSTSLTYAGYNSSGIGGSAGFLFRTTSAEDANRSTIPYTSGSVYVSFLLNITASGGTTGDYFFHVMDTVAISSFRGRIFIKDGSLANTFNIGLNKGSTTAPNYSGNYPLNTTLLVVMKYSFNATVADTVYTYIFTSGVPAVEPAVANLVSPDISTADLAIFNSVAIRQGAVGVMAGTIDGIRISNTWGNGVLPVQFGKFDAFVNANRGTTLAWNTLSELNNSGFEIERSTDGQNFEMIGFAEGAGNSNVEMNYTFDYSSNESAFYRLKQVDFDGKADYSKVVFVKGKESDAVLTPNPFNNTIKISSESTIERAEIIDMMGKVVLTENINSNNASINANELMNGVYFIKVYQGDVVSTQRIIKTN